MPYKKHFSRFVLIVCLFAVQRLAAQPCWECNHFEITTDYNTCLQGLKDTTGNWVVEPKYEQLYFHTRAHYIAGYGGKYGLIDTAGRILIPIQYDWVREGLPLWRNSSHIFVVTLNGKSGVVDSLNRNIVPVIYDEIFVFPDSVVSARLGKKEWYFYKLDGTSKKLPFKSKRRPWFLARHLYSVGKKKDYNSKRGVIDDSCRMILPMKYDDIDVYPRTKIFMLSRKGKFGYCSFAGKMIWPLVFDNELGAFRRPSERGAESVGITGYGCVKHKDKYGMISSTGDTVLPFVYDYIEPYDYRLDANRKNIWLVTQGGKHGMYMPGSGWVMEMEFDSILTLERFLSPSDSSIVGLVCARKNGKWGAQTTSGQKVMDYKYETCYQYDEKAFFRLGDSLFCLSPIPEFYDHVLIRSMKQDSSRSHYPMGGHYHSQYTLEIPANQQFAVEHGKNNCIVFYNPEHRDDTVRTRDSVYVMTGKHDWGFYVNDRILIASAFCVQPLVLEKRYSDSLARYSFRPLLDPDSTARSSQTIFVYTDPASGKKITDGKGHVVYDARYSYFITQRSAVFRSDGKILSTPYRDGVTHEKFSASTGELFFETRGRNYKGTTIIDTAGNVIVPSRRTTIGSFTREYAWIYGRSRRLNGWQLVDLRTNQLITPEKSFFDNEAPVWKNLTVTEDKNGTRLYSITEKKSLTPGFNSIDALNKDGAFFAVKTCKGKIGAVDQRGKQVIDTVWESYVPVEYLTSTIPGNEDSEYRYHNSNFYHYYVFYNDTSSVCFDALTGTIVADSALYPILWKASVTPSPSDSVKHAVYYENWMNNDGFDFKCDLQLSEKDSLKFLPWQQRCVLDSMYAPRRLEQYDDSYSYPCNYCRRQKGFFFSYPFQWIKAYDKHGAIFRVSSLGDSLVSFYTVNRYRYMSHIDPYRFNFSNVMMFPEGPRELTIDSLFTPTSDWRNLIINTIITYVNSHTGIKGDCHNPAAFPVMLKQSFLVTAEGLRLYPPGFEENNDQLVITLPWNELDPYLRNDIRSKLPVAK